ncbi:hypothetical protein BD560DRAFT_420582 [Blakeslea trispora]|nr:hypothetical protein BD560DRAFT_420582 [Blakeslea trispora]
MRDTKINTKILQVLIHVDQHSELGRIFIFAIDLSSDKIKRNLARSIFVLARAVCLVYLQLNALKHPCLIRFKVRLISNTGVHERGKWQGNMFERQVEILKKISAASKRKHNSMKIGINQDKLRIPCKNGTISHFIHFHKNKLCFNTVQLSLRKEAKEELHIPLLGQPCFMSATKLAGSIEINSINGDNASTS